MDTGLISYLVGVTGASFMSSNALFSLFNGKLRHIRYKARKEYAKVVEEHSRKKQDGGENGGKGKNGGNGKKVENVGLNVMREHKQSAEQKYIVWLVFNTVPVVISFFLALVVSVPVLVPVVKDWAEKGLVLLLKLGLAGLVISLIMQAYIIRTMFKLLRKMDQRMETSPEPDTVFEK